MKKIQTDAVIDVSRGDCSKLKITYSLLKNSYNNEYTRYDQVWRINGGQNVGGTFYHNRDKFVVHMVPAGVVFNIKSIIGNNCVFNIKKLFNEIDSLQKQFSNHEDLKNINIRNLIKIDQNAFIVSEENLLEDAKEELVGSTKQGVAQCVRDKYARVGKQAKEFPELKEFLVDSYEELFDGKPKKILLEGAQGFYLDPNFAEYPYCTSTHCSIGTAFLNGIPPSSIRTIYGAAKVYETYVGKMKFQPDDPIFDEIAVQGVEIGNTSGRRRQCRWLNMNELIKAIKINDIDILILSKLDVLEKINTYKLTYNHVIESFATSKDFCNRIEEILDKYHDCEIIFSSSPYEI